MKRIFIDKLNREFKLELCKVNKEVICSVPTSCLQSLNRSLNEIDKLEITVDKYITNHTGKKIVLKFNHTPNVLGLNDLNNKKRKRIKI